MNQGLFAQASNLEGIAFRSSYLCVGKPALPHRFRREEESPGCTGRRTP